MAYYLESRFRDDPDVHVLHGLKLEDVDRAQPDGSPGGCRIDHLLVHRWGMFVVESRSMAGEVRIRPNCPDGDGWSHLYRGRETGMPSPMLRAGRQFEFLRSFLQRSRDDIAQSQPSGLRAIVRRKPGGDRPDFTHAPMRLAIAVSDYATMKEVDAWAAAREPSGTIVDKADMLPERLCRALERHRRGAGILGVRSFGEHGQWRMEAQEAANVASLLAARHVDPSAGSGASAQAPRAGAAACMHCGAGDLVASCGRFGHFWRCGACGKNTPMPLVCSACGVQGRRDNAVRIRRQATDYVRDCDKCGFSEKVWSVADEKPGARAPSTAA